MMNSNAGIYLHVPFCIRKCDYCDFYSIIPKEKVVTKYFNALEKQIIDSIDEWKKFDIDTLYIGGGTPSSVDACLFEPIFDLLWQVMDIEKANITIEMNPGTVTERKLAKYIELGIDRASIGFQSLNDKLLKNIGRIHDAKTAIDTYKKVRSAGFNDVSIDMMFALPCQTMDIWEDTVKRVLDLSPNHISAYALTIEENTPIAKKYSDGIYVADDNRDREMYWFMKELLEKEGYIHYEISNFSKEGFESKHNLKYWDLTPYMALGAGAYGFDGKTRYCMADSVLKYVENPNKRYDEIKLSKEDMMDEFSMLGLRKLKGIDTKEFNRIFGISFYSRYKEKVEKLFDLGILTYINDCYCLTDKGLDYANIAFMEFV